MRENRPYGSEGGEAKAFPTPIIEPYPRAYGSLTSAAAVNARGYRWALLPSSLMTRRGMVGN